MSGGQTGIMLIITAAAISESMITIAMRANIE
jgi:DNA segregation ATPase FtsK/SpoIIIE-like protein